MKKIILSTLVLLIVMSSCSSKDKETNKLIGTWEHISTKVTNDKGVKKTIINTITLVFQDKQFSIKEVTTVDGKETATETKEYIYTYTSTTINAKFMKNGLEKSFNYGTISKTNEKEILKFPIREEILDFTKKG